VGYPLKHLKECSFPNGVTVQNCSLLKIIFRVLISLWVRTIRATLKSYPTRRTLPATSNWL
jgi:hypothetical protein